MAAAVAMATAAACAEGVEPSPRAQQTDAGGRGGSGGSSGTSNAGSGGSSFGGSGAVTTGGSGGAATGGSGGVATGGVGGVGGSGGSGTGGASGGSGGATGSGGSATGGTGTSGGSGGTGGVSGTGGTTATDGASGTGGSTGNCPAASPEAGTGVVTLQLKNNEDTGPSNPDIRPTLNIINTSGGAIDLTAITIRYWFTPEGTGTLVVACYNACNGITTTFVDVSPARTGATKYLEVGFSSGTLSAGASITDLKLHIHTSSYENQDETNDYSYCTLPNYINWDRVTVYQNSALIWGIEP